MCPQEFTYYLAMYVAILYNNYVQYYADQQLDYSVAIYSSGCLTIVSASPYKFTISQIMASIILLDTTSPIFNPCQGEL